MSNLEVLELTEKSIRSGISNLFWQNLLGSIFMGQFCRKIVFEGYVLNLQGLNMQTTKKTLIFDNFFFLVIMDGTGTDLVQFTLCQ